jgi:hypothetical protein
MALLCDGQVVLWLCPRMAPHFARRHVPGLCCLVSCCGVCRYLPHIDTVTASAAAQDTPFHFIHGDRDFVIPIGWMRASARKFEALGLNVSGVARTVLLMP